MEILLHCADISNPYKPFQICAKWADLVSQEFFSQGDKERELGIDISPMMDRNSSNLNNMQIGFIEFVVSPLISSESSLSPSPPPLLLPFPLTLMYHSCCEYLPAPEGDRRDYADELFAMGETA
jgi:hypothetical protein